MRISKRKVASWAFKHVVIGLPLLSVCCGIYVLGKILDDDRFDGITVTL